MATGQYFYNIEHVCNVFGADEHIRVSLWKERKTDYKWINSWNYSTFLSSAWANARAESRIRKLRETYDAKSLPV